MATQKGKDLLLKLVPTGGGTAVTVAGLRTKKIAFNTQGVDVTDSESAGRWRELLSGAGVQRCALTGSGIFKDLASDAEVRGAFFTGALRDWQIVIPDFGTVAGPFLITALEYAGNHDGELTFELALESAGVMTFAVAP
jgi:TP901-1 family phage major tail protein